MKPTCRDSSTDAIDPGCVKTLRGITAPGILGSTVTRRAKKRKNLSSARHYDQIRFRFHTAKTHCRHESRTGGDLERVAAGSMPPLAGEEVGQGQGKLVPPM